MFFFNLDIIQGRFTLHTRLPLDTFFLWNEEQLK